MTDAKKAYTGPERRLSDECSQHCKLEDVVSKSVPRWVFSTAMSVMVVVSLAFGGWHASQMRDLKKEVSEGLSEMETRLEVKMENLKEKYTGDIGRFYRAAERNGQKLDDVARNQNDIKVTMQDFKTKQDMVLKRVRLGNGEFGPIRK